MHTNHAKHCSSNHWRTALLVALFVAMPSCQSSDALTSTIIDDATNVYWAGRLNHHAITLSTHAPWDTVYLSMTPLNVYGDTLPDDGSVVQYQSSDSNKVSVTADGFVRAKNTTGSVSVIARLTLGGLTYADTALVQVINNPSPPRLDVLSIQPTPPDSAKFSTTTYFVGDFRASVGNFLNITAVDGTDMSNVLVYYRSEDPLIVPVDRQFGDIDPCFCSYRRVGTANVIATTFAYGVSRADTLAITTGRPLNAEVQFVSRTKVIGEGVETYTLTTDLTVGVGAEVTLVNNGREEVSFVFDDTTNIVVSQPLYPDESVNWTLARGEPGLGGEYVYRRFDVPGTYTWRDARLGLIGRIHVIDERVSSAPSASQRTLRLKRYP